MTSPDTTTPLCPCGCLRPVTQAWTGRRRQFASEACRKRVWERRNRPPKAKRRKAKRRAVKSKG